MCKVYLMLFVKIVLFPHTHCHPLSHIKVTFSQVYNINTNFFALLNIHGFQAGFDEPPAN